MSEEKFYWLKLQHDFFQSKRIKKLRSIAGGDTYTIIYLKMQLLSLDKGGTIQYSGLESSFAEELALDLDENAEDVAVTLQYLSRVGLLETSDDINYLLPYAVENTGSEGSSARRMRKLREKQSSQSDGGVTQLLQNCYGEKEIEIDKDIDIDIKSEKPKKVKKKDFNPPTLKEVEDYIKEKGYSINPKEFFDFYDVSNWIDSQGKPVLNWKQRVITWQGRVKKPKSNGFHNFDERKNDLDSDVMDKFNQIMED